MIAINCPHCGRPIRGGDEYAGRVVLCPSCKSKVQMPSIASSELQPTSAPVSSPSPVPPPVQAPAKSSEWYVQVEGEEFGPYPGVALKKFAAEGRVTTSTQVKKGRVGQWVAAQTVKGLFALPSPPPFPEPQLSSAPVSVPVVVPMASAATVSEGSNARDASDALDLPEWNPTPPSDALDLPEWNPPPSGDSPHPRRKTRNVTILLGCIALLLLVPLLVSTITDARSKSVSTSSGSRDISAAPNEQAEARAVLQAALDSWVRHETNSVIVLTSRAFRVNLLRYEILDYQSKKSEFHVFHVFAVRLDIETESGPGSKEIHVNLWKEKNKWSGGEGMMF